MQTRKTEQPAETVPERRLHLRVKLMAPIVGRALGHTDTFTVEDASLGGFSIESHIPFVLGRDYRFWLSNQSTQSTIVEAACRYCNLLHTGDDAGAARYLVGFEFLPQRTARLRLILGAIAADTP